MIESDLQQAISTYTINHKRLPNAIQANFITGMQMSKFPNFVSKDKGAAYKTPFGEIPIVLNENAADFFSGGL